MAVSMMTTQDTVMQEWKSIFPDFATLEGSCLFIKKLIAVSLSAITYIRGIFPEKAYGERNLGGLKLKLLTEDCGIKAVSKFIDSVRSCYDAVEKKYLQQLSIGICVNKENHNEVIEAYNLVFSYKDDECSVTCCNKTKSFSPKLNDPTVKASFLMLKNISTISNMLGNLPDNVYLTLKLLYYDDVTPEDYEPPGFEPSSHVKFSFPHKTMNVSLGKIDTDQHGYKLLLKTTMTKQLLSQSNSGELVAQSSQASTHAKETVTNEDLVDSHQPSETMESEKSENINEITGLNCPCKCKLAEEYDTILCSSCEWLQHKTCYGILNPDNIPPVFYCVNCIPDKEKNSMFLDSVYSFQGKIRKEFCCTRRALSLCLTLRSITKASLEKLLGFSRATATALIRRLEAEELIKPQADSDSYNVARSNIENYGLKEYFPSSDNKENEPEILEESLEIDTNPVTVNCTAQVHEMSSSSITEMSDIEGSIKKVRDLNIQDMSPDRIITRSSQKRKASSEILNLDDSELLFQSQKRPRLKKNTNKRVLKSHLKQ